MLFWTKRKEISSQSALIQPCLPLSPDGAAQAAKAEEWLPDSHLLKISFCLLLSGGHTSLLKRQAYQRLWQDLWQTSCLSHVPHSVSPLLLMLPLKAGTREIVSLAQGSERSGREGCTVVSHKVHYITGAPSTNTLNWSFFFFHCQKDWQCAASQYIKKDACFNLGDFVLHNAPPSWATVLFLCNFRSYEMIHGFCWSWSQPRPFIIVNNLLLLLQGERQGICASQKHMGENSSLEMERLCFSPSS